MLKKYTFRSLLLSSFFFLTFSLNAQMAIAVSKNNNGSSVKYAFETGATIDEALNKAVNTLKEADEKNIFKLKSTEKTGHTLREGYYVIILSSRKVGGHFFLSYGLGGSKESRQDAIKKAIVHLKEFDWGYENNMGYKIEKEGKIEDLFPVVEE